MAIQARFNPSIGFLPILTADLPRAGAMIARFNPSIGFLPILTPRVQWTFCDMRWFQSLNRVSAYSDDPVSADPQRRGQGFNPSIGFLPILTQAPIMLAVCVLELFQSLNRVSAYSDHTG